MNAFALSRPFLVAQLLPLGMLFSGLLQAQASLTITEPLRVSTLPSRQIQARFALANTGLTSIDVTAMVGVRDDATGANLDFPVENVTVPAGNTIIYSETRPALNKTATAWPAVSVDGIW